MPNFFEKIASFVKNETESDKEAEKLINEVIPDVTHGHNDQERLIITLERPGEQLPATPEAKAALDNCLILLDKADISEDNKERLKKAIETIRRIYRDIDQKEAA